ncbi:hypothetical protein ASE06_09405 [Sphingopyxis sp. Root214]|nr:hypothetical protein ASD73_07050 [Sphingopyxis sp. Root154]KRC06842.1 hypothetical protein ASE06_09405 [Sphingopyxis sp. Root214]
MNLEDTFGDRDRENVVPVNEARRVLANQLSIMLAAHCVALRRRSRRIAATLCSQMPTEFGIALCPLSLFGIGRSIILFATSGRRITVVALGDDTKSSDLEEFEACLAWSDVEMSWKDLDAQRDLERQAKDFLWSKSRAAGGD